MKKISKTKGAILETAVWVIYVIGCFGLGIIIANGVDSCFCSKIRHKVED